MEIREAMEKAAESVSSAPAPVETTSTVEAAPVETTSTETPETLAPEAAPALPGRARDEAGRFTKASDKPAAEKPPAAPKGDVNGAASAAPSSGPGKADGAVPSPAPSAEPVTPAVKAPQSWTPQAREAFAKAPPEVQREVDRREREMSRFVNETAPVRQFAQQAQSELARYDGIARQHGMDSFAWAGQVLQQFGAPLFSGNPRAAAVAIAKAIAFSGASTDDINAALQNPQAAPQPQAQPQQPPQEQWNEERLEKWYEHRQIKQQIDDYMATGPEFLEADVPWEQRSDGAKRLMANMVAYVQTQRSMGRNVTLEQARMAAVRMDDEFSAIANQRKAAEAARTAQATTARTQAAASSVKSTPAAAPARTAQPKSIREAMDAADATLSGRV